MYPYRHLHAIDTLHIGLSEAFTVKYKQNGIPTCNKIVDNRKKILPFLEIVDKSIYSNILEAIPIEISKNRSRIFVCWGTQADSIELSFFFISLKKYIYPEELDIRR